MARVLRLLLVTALVGALVPSIASARRITKELARVVALVREHGTNDEADALQKLFEIQGYDDIPLHKSFVDASIGRDSINFIERQERRLAELLPRRPYLRRVLVSLRDARLELARQGFLNHREDEPMPSDRVLLDDYQFNEPAFRAAVRTLAGEQSVTVRELRGQRARRVRLDNRYMGMASNKLSETVQYLRRYYETLGLHTEVEPVVWRGRRYFNVIATVQGTTPDTLIVGAHYDTALDERAPRGVRRAAPGADDNGSGNAALMEIGQALRGRTFEKTVRLVHFVGEELPAALLGSRVHAIRAVRNGESVHGVFILDGIGFNRDERSRAFVHTNLDERSLFLASEIVRASGRLGTGLRFAGRVPTDGNGEGVNIHDADTAPFARKGIPVVWLAEDFRFGRGVHDGDDVSSRLDYRFAGRVVHAAAEAIARVARPTERFLPVREADISSGTALGQYRTKRLSGRDDLMSGRREVREAYQPVALAMLDEPRRRVDAAARRMNRLARDATEFRALPRVVTDAEFDDVERGLVQIERTMQLALRDIYKSRSPLLREGVVTHEELAATDFSDWYLGARDRGGPYNFMMRPDLVRDQNGRITILEINMGYLGGFGDFVRVRRLLRETNPRVFDYAQVHPVEDFSARFARMLRHMSSKPNPRVVFSTVGTATYGDDREDQELARILGEQGIEYVSARTEQQLITDRGRVYLVSPNRRGRELIDVVYTRGDWLTPEMEAAAVNGGVKVFPTPGSGVFQSKNLYSKMPQLIRHYLGEEPVFRFLESRSFARPDGTLNRRFLEHALAHPEGWVFKAAMGYQGIGTLVGRHATQAELQEFREKIERSPGAWDAQQYVEPTTLNGERVDFNPYIVTINGERYVPRTAMIRTARGRDKFGDNPGFLDGWVLDSRRPRDYLAPRTGTARARIAQRRRNERDALTSRNWYRHTPRAPRPLAHRN